MLRSISSMMFPVNALIVIDNYAGDSPIHIPPKK